MVDNILGNAIERAREGSTSIPIDIAKKEYEAETGILIDDIVNQIMELKKSTDKKKDYIKGKKDELRRDGHLSDELDDMIDADIEATKILGKLKIAPQDHIYVTNNDHTVVLHNAVIDTYGSDKTVVIAALYIDGFVEQKYGIMTGAITEEDYPNSDWWLAMHLKEFTFYNYIKYMVKPQAEMKLKEVTEAWDSYLGKVGIDINKYDKKDVKSIIGRFKIGELNGEEDIYLFKDYIEFALSSIDTYLNAPVDVRKTMWRNGMLKYREKEPKIVSDLDYKLITISNLQTKYEFNQ